MFVECLGKAGRLSTPNIAQAARRIAICFSFFIHYFLAVSFPYCKCDPSLRLSPCPAYLVECGSKSSLLAALIHISAVDKPTCPQTQPHSRLLASFFNLALIWPSSTHGAFCALRPGPANDDWLLGLGYARVESYFCLPISEKPAKADVRNCQHSWPADQG